MIVRLSKSNFLKEGNVDADKLAKEVLANYTFGDIHPNVIVDTEYCKGRVILNVTGKATCSSEDGFDSKRGERIAESRAKIALYKFMTTLLNKIIMHYRKLIFGDMDIRIPELYKDGIYKYYCKYSQYLETEWKHLNNLIHNQKD